VCNEEGCVTWDALGEVRLLAEPRAERGDVGGVHVVGGGRGQQAPPERRGDQAAGPGLDFGIRHPKHNKTFAMF